MNYSCPAVRPPSFVRLLRAATSLFLLITASAVLRAADGGSITGSVTSSKTRNALQGATVTVPSLNRTELTDSAGAFAMPNLPAGQVEVIISYSGFEEERKTVMVQAGQATRLDSEMKPTGTIMMDAFTVATQREGQALSITEQRNAYNVKTVTAFDEWGILPTQNVGELATRLPGITFTTDEDQLINNISIGGQPSSYTRLNVDGMSTTGVGGDGRTATLHSFSGSNYEAIEIIAGQTPDKRADSLGGQVNLKTKSPLAMRERRRSTYNFSARYFPSWSDRNFAVSQRPWRPDLSVSHTEVFDVGGGVRNLGIVVSGAYQEVLNPHNWDLWQYENTTAPVAQVRDYARWSGLNDRFLSAFTARADYRVSQSTMVSLRFIYNAGSEPFFNYTQVQAFSLVNLTVNSPTNPTGAIRAGFTATQLEYLPVANATLQPGGVSVGAAQVRLSPRDWSFTSKNPTGTLAFEHNWGRLKVDHAYRFSNTHWDSNAGRQREGGQLDVRTKDPIGFIIDVANPRGKTFTWTGGANPYQAASYTPFVITAANTTTQPVAQTSTVFTKRDNVTDTNEAAGTINASYLLATERPTTIKVGLDTVNRRHNTRAVYPRRWYQIPGTVLPADGLEPLTEFEMQNGGPRLPVFDPSYISTTLNNTALWYEDVNFTATSQPTNRRIMEEGVDAAYVQGQTKFGRLTVLGGVRGEWVTTDTFITFRARSTAIAVEPDHFKRAKLDFNNLSRDGKYHNFFPSLHLAYDFTRNFKARASWSNSYGRPGIASILSTPTASDTARTVTMGNPALKPQIADNIDAKLEYYFAGSGMISVRGYRKNIEDYIGSASRSGLLVPDGPDNGFDGLYGGYEIIQVANLGDAKLKGLEFDYRQTLTFLPGAFKGLTVRGNYTYLETSGRFAGTTDLKNGQVAGFIPRAFNVGLLYQYRKFGASFDMNYTGRYPVGYSLTSPGSGNIYRDAWKIMNAGVTYKLRSEATLFFNINNIAQEGAEQYTFLESRHRSGWIVPRTVKFGVTGQF
jgi:iron complex outermembrane recepter protein